MSAGSATTAAALGERCARIVAAELDRLHRRTPGLGPREIGVVAETLERLTDRLVIHPVRGHPHHEDAIEALFAISDDVTRRETGHE